MDSTIAIYLSAKADSETRQRFFVAVDQLSEMLKAGITIENEDEKPRIRICALENSDEFSSVVWISVFGAERISTRKMLVKLLMERHRVGDKYEVVVNPTPSLK